MSPVQRERFERLAREEAASVYRTARRVVARGDLAEEVTQEVFVRVLKRPETYLDRVDAEPGRALRWLAVKMGLEVLRRDRNRIRREERAMETADDRTTRHDEPSERSASREAHAALERALERLPDELRLPIVLRFQEGFTFSEIATATAVSEPSAHDRVRRGIEKLRAFLTTAGFAAVAATIEGAITSAPAPEAPADLASRMASLHGTAAAGSGIGVSGLQTTTPMVVTGALGVALVTVAAALGLGLGSTPVSTPVVASIPRATGEASGESGVASSVSDSFRSLVAATTTETSEGSRREVGVVAPPPPPARSDPFATLDRATISGRVTVHRDDAELLPSIEVVATSLRHASKGDRVRWTTAVKADGSYSLEVPVEADGAYFQTWIEYAAARLSSRPDRKIDPNAVVADHDFEFEERIGERAGEFELIATVTDENGTPRAGESIVLYRLIEYVGEQPFAAHEAGGTTDANGRVRLRGSKLGRKKLSLGAWLGETLSSSVDFEIDRPGGVERTFSLSLPSEIEREAAVYRIVSGRLVDAATGEPIRAKYHSVELVAPPPAASLSTLREDWLPAVAWLAPSRQVEIPFDAVATDRFEAATIEPGEYFLVAWRMPFAPFVSGPHDLTETLSIENVTIAFQAAATVRGRVVGEDGRPLSRAHLVVSGVGPFSDARIAEIDAAIVKQSGEGYVHGSVARTGDDGRFELRSAPLDSPFRLIALHPGHAHAGTSWITLRSGATLADLEIVLSSPRR